MKTEFKYVMWYTCLALLVIIIVTAVLFAVNAVTYPAWMGIQRKAVENSKSFTDSNNVMLTKYMQDYSALDVKIAETTGDTSAYKSQQQAILNLMCTQISTMKSDTVNPSTMSWISSHGGCR